PAGRGDVEVHVAGLQPDPVHRGQVSGRVGGVRVLDELGLAGGSGGEVQQQGVVGVGGVARLEVGGGVHRGREIRPTVRGAADGDALVVTLDAGEAVGELGAGDDVPDAAPGDPVPQVALGEQRRGGDDHGAELDHREHDVPQFDLVGEHQQDPVARADAVVAEEVRGAVRADPHLVEGVHRLGGG